MKSCNHYKQIDGVYKPLIKCKGEYYICTQCCRLMTKNDANLVNEYCSIKTSLNNKNNMSVLQRELLQGRLVELKTWLHPRFPYQK